MRTPPLLSFPYEEALKTKSLKHADSAITDLKATTLGLQPNLSMSRGS